MVIMGCCAKCADCAAGHVIHHHAEGIEIRSDIGIWVDVGGAGRGGGCHVAVLRMGEVRIEGEEEEDRDHRAEHP